MPTKEDLIFKVATAARNHHYCATGSLGNLCESCKDDGVCHELQGSEIATWVNDVEWCASAMAAIEVIEQEFSIQFLPKDKA